MALKLPRSVDELAPRLHAISELALDRFDEPEPHPLLELWWLASRVASGRAFWWYSALLALSLAALAGRLWFEARAVEIGKPSAFAVRAEVFRAQLRQCESEARACRALAASGRNGVIGGIPLTPRMATRQAKLADIKAASFRRLAHAEDCRDLGLPAP